MHGSLSTVCGAIVIATALVARASEENPGPSAIEGPTWRLVQLGEQDRKALAAVPRAVTARFQAGRVDGFSGCNQYAGPYTIVGDHIRLGGLAGTMMACAEPIMAVETAFKNAFIGSLAYAIADGRLTLAADSGATLVFEEEPPPTLEGDTWEVTGFNDGRQAVVSPVIGTTLTLSFGDRAITGSSGCNSYRAAYTHDGEHLTIGPVATTRKACPAEGVMEQEQQFVEALHSAAKWTIRDGRLDLYRADGARALSAKRGRE